MTGLATLTLNMFLVAVAQQQLAAARRMLHAEQRQL